MAFTGKFVYIYSLNHCLQQKKFNDIYKLIQTHTHTHTVTHDIQSMQILQKKDQHNTCMKSCTHCVELQIAQIAQEYSV